MYVFETSLKLRLDIFEDAPVFIRMFLTALLVLLDLSVTNAGSNHFVNREMALHAKALDEMYTISHQGISYGITKDINIDIKYCRLILSSFNLYKYLGKCCNPCRPCPVPTFPGPCPTCNCTDLTHHCLHGGTCNERAGLCDCVNGCSGRSCETCDGI